MAATKGGRLMVAKRVLPHCWRPLTILLSIALAFLASGCLWGVVTDADTGDPLAGVSVTYTDSHGQTGTTVTDENGIYSFDQASGPVPAMGPVTFEVNADGYDPLTQPRSVEYNDGLWPNLENLSSFWEVQHFSLSGGSGKYHNGEWGFSITFPRGWEIEESPYGDGAIASPPDEETLESPVFPMCYVFAGEFPAGMSLEGYIELSMTAVRGNVKDFRIREQKETQLGGEDATRLVYSGKVEAEEDFELSFKFLAYVLRKGANVYVAECGVFALDCSEYSFDCTTAEQGFRMYEDTFEQFAQSFRFE
jgi:hypothetical protein